MMFMKKACISFGLILIIILLAIFGVDRVEANEQFLRIHIRANSNLAVDQAIKYEIRDEVIAYLTPYIITCQSLSDAKEMLKSQKTAINRLIEGFLHSRGFSYGAKTYVTSEEFPLRIYDGITLEAGIYDALIVELGEAEGDNWWCVVYPPLCFSDTKNVKYRSIILDIINKYKNK